VLGTLQVGLAYALLVRAMPQVPHHRIAAADDEPALNPLWAFFALDERPPALAIAGGAVIIGVVVVGNLLATARAPRSPPRSC
jgi:drug/metabolite transporter (DMT)-like permease